VTTKNPRIAGYVSKEVHAALHAFMAERGIDGVSSALNLILEEYLNCCPEPDASLSDRLCSAESKIEALEQELQGLREAIDVVRILRKMPKEEIPTLSDFFKSAHEKHYGNGKR